ncbi:MAG: hypothetical protein QW220_02150 [Candidatus Bathyarchaeia archaeon]
MDKEKLESKKRPCDTSGRVSCLEPTPCPYMQLIDSGEVMATKCVYPKLGSYVSKIQKEKV